MASITPSIEPRYYSTPQTVSFTASPEIDQIANSVNGIAPAISEYIAYDDLDPPSPFLAVTQDGKGNVVYDGGFPKFYNRTLPDTPGTTFDTLEPSYKFLYNALNFTANPEKAKRVLVIGNNVNETSYWVKATTEQSSSGFASVLSHVTSVAGFDLTIKDRNDWGGTIDITLAELDTYACVIVMGTRSGLESYDDITEAAVQDIVTYREQGNGIILITDHGDVVPDLNAATQPHNGFFAVVNRIAVNFGAYFTGDYDRTDVNVGFLRTTYGDHPLYNNLDDSDDIRASWSESRVVVTEVDTYAPDTIPDITLDSGGQYDVNFLGILADGSVITEAFSFTVTDGEFMFPQKPNGELGTDHQLTTYRALSDFALRSTASGQGTLQGWVQRNGRRMGRFQADGNGTTYTWLVPGSGGFPVNDGDVVGIEVDSPLRYYTEYTVSKTPAPAVGRDVAKALTNADTDDLSGLDRASLIHHLAAYTQRHFHQGTATQPKYPLVLNALAGHLPYPTLTIPVVETTADLPTVGDSTVIVLGSVSVAYVAYQVDGEWRHSVSNTLDKYIAGPRDVIDSQTDTRYHFDGTDILPV